MFRLMEVSLTDGELVFRVIPELELYHFPERMIFGKPQTFEFSEYAQWIEEGEMLADDDGKILIYENGTWQTIWPDD